MRILPDHPSVDFLRREAKDVLDALRESEPSTALSAAQRVVAERYGFRTWAELKAEVERRRASVPAAEVGLAEELARAFGLGDVVAPMAPVAFDHTGRRWCLTTEQGRFALRPVFEWIDEAQAERSALLAEAARGAGIAAPEAVRGADARLVQRVAGEPWRADRWIEHGPAPLPPVASPVAQRAGEVLATLHALAIPAGTGVNPYLTYVRPEGHWHELVGRARAAGAPWAARLGALLPTIADLRAAVVAWVPADPILCACNLIPEAVRLGGGGDLVLAPLDFAGALTPDRELASALLHWTVFGAPNESAVRPFVEGYASVAGGLPDVDVESFGVAIAGWLNWLHGQACTAIGDDDPEARAIAEAELDDLLDDPLTTATVERMAAAVGSVGV